MMKAIPTMISAALTLAGIAHTAAGAEMTGAQVFEHYCSHCHGPVPSPGTVQLARTRGKDQALLTERTDLAAEYVAYIVRHGLKSMPPFTPADLTDAQLVVLAAFLAKKPSP